MNNSHMKKFDSFDDFFGKRIFPRFLIFSYLGLFLALLYLPFDYLFYKNSPYLTGALIARGLAIFFAVMVVLSLKLDFFAKKRVIAITTFGTMGYTALTFSYISYEAPSFFIMYNWFFYLVATMMLGALITKKIFIIMESFQIIVVIVLMLYFKKHPDEIFLYCMVAFSLVAYVYAVVRLNRKNGEEAYDNAFHMYIISSTDGLSGLLNRRTWYEKSELFFQSISNISFIMLDIDHFKKVNDTYGHDMGDIVIKEVSNILLEQTRENDILGRLGGEEFGILLLDSDYSVSLKIAERIKNKIQETTISHNDISINVTVSIGIALKNENTKTLLELIKLADLNLYEAKQTGRNKIVI